MRDLSRARSSMNDKINLAEKFAQLPDAYQPAIVGYMNDYKLVVVKTQGEFVWHKHDETDELFLIVNGPADDPVPRPRRRARARASCSSSRAASSTARRPTRRPTSC